MSARFHQQVIDEFAEWARAHGHRPADEADQRWRDRITILLQGRADYLGQPDPTRWRSGDVHDLFMDYVVPRQFDAWDLAGRGLATFRDYLTFLDATDRLHPASTRVPTLRKELDRLETKYPAAMADASAWRLAKTVFTAAAADGIPFDAGPAVLDAWAERFSARDAAGRRQVLGRLMDGHPEYATGRLFIHDSRVAMVRAGTPPAKHLVWPDLACDCGCEQPTEFPPIALPDEALLAKEVGAGPARLLRQLATLSTWIGAAGRPVDDRGELRKNDRLECLGVLGLPVDARLRGELPAFGRLWLLAIEVDVIQVRRTRIVPGGGAGLVAAALTGEGSPEQTLELWCDLADAILDPPALRSAPKGSEHLRDWMQPWAPRFLGLLYAANAAGERGDLDTLIALLLAEYGDRLPPGNPAVFAGLASLTVRQTLAELADHGAVAVAGLADEYDPRHVATAAVVGTAVWALEPGPGVTVDLTDLGRFLVRRRLLAEGAHAPLIG